jgi:hypothetical protein
VRRWDCASPRARAARPGLCTARGAAGRLLERCVRAVVGLLLVRTATTTRVGRDPRKRVWSWARGQRNFSQRACTYAWWGQRGRADTARAHYPCEATRRRARYASA